MNTNPHIDKDILNQRLPAVTRETNGERAGEGIVEGHTSTGITLLADITNGSAIRVPDINDTATLHSLDRGWCERKRGYFLAVLRGGGSG